MKRKTKAKEELTPKQIMGKKSKVMGFVNENRSIQYILSNYSTYGVPGRNHIYFTPRGSKHHMDLFSTKYFDGAGNLCFAGFDIVALSGRRTYGACTTLVQVKSTRLPTKQYLRMLCEFPVATSCRKELHLWIGDKLHIYPLDSIEYFSKIKKEKEEKK